MRELFKIDQYQYHLPENRIAKYPLEKRDASKLLLWDKGQISHHHFSDVPDLIPENSLLVFNDTRVISARIVLTKSTGARIEVFLLHPESPTRDIQEAMTLKGPITWHCMIGNKKKWKDGILQKRIDNEMITASYQDREMNFIRFEWTGKDTFADIVNKTGETPLPPYLKRPPIEEDSRRYQTIYSQNNGAVAAPTAGLHFTSEVLNRLKKQKIQTEYLTLHVSAGTFKPVETADFRNHDMHSEQIVVNKQRIEKLIQNHGRIIAVGTTSLRILESLYWYGVNLMNNPEAIFSIDKDMPYRQKTGISYPQALGAVLDYFDRQNLVELHGETQIYIYPGYKIRSSEGLITNFHLPKSTLLLLISSFVNGKWKDIYDEALANDYRFLSYGDSSLLLR